MTFPAEFWLMYATISYVLAWAIWEPEPDSSISWPGVGVGALGTVALSIWGHMVSLW